MGTDAGSLIVIGLPGPEVSAADRSLIEDLRPAGVILFDRNARSAGQIAGLCRDFSALLGDPPPLILLDHEGGRVNRLPVAFTHFPSQGALGAVDDPELTAAV
ncbi:MAG: glycoside hydrolase family 3 N-terminal domain-containing protein, partial [Nitrospinota bacterium]